MSRSLNGAVTDPHQAAQTLSGGGAEALLDAAPAGRRDALDHTLHAVFASGHNTLALTAGALTLTGAAFVLWLTRRPRKTPGRASDAAGQPPEGGAGAVPVSGGTQANGAERSVGTTD